MSTTAQASTPAQATVNDPLEPTQRAAESGTFLRYIRRSNGPRQGMTPQIEAALRDRYRHIGSSGARMALCQE